MSYNPFKIAWDDMRLYIAFGGGSITSIIWGIMTNEKVALAVGFVAGVVSIVGGLVSMTLKILKHIKNK